MFRKLIYLVLLLLLGACSLPNLIRAEDTTTLSLTASLPVTPSLLPSVTLQSTLTRSITPSPIIKMSSTRPPISSSTPMRQPTSIETSWVVRMACQTLIMHNSNPFRGRVVRFNTPILVNTRGIAAAIEALEVVEVKTNHIIKFKQVDQDPQVGIIFILGDAVRPEGTPGCGNVTSDPDPKSGVHLAAAADGQITGRMFVHLGGINSPGCKYSPDRKPYPIAEHELGHALGLGGHFTNFNGDEGFSDELAEVIKLLYSLPVGMNANSMCP